MDIIQKVTVAGELELLNELSIGGDIQMQNPLVVGGDIQFTGGAERYKGEYEVIPMTYDQTLETAHKLMEQDVLVHEIPYDETSNQYGTTVVIAS